MKFPWTKLILVFLLPLAFIACNLDPIDVPEIVPLPTIEAYLDSNSINAIEDSSGLYYVIEEMGTGDMPTLSDSVVVKYTGRLTNDYQFDSSNGNAVTFKLSGLIEGWKIGLQLLNRGSKATFYVPPSLGYGANGIPGTVIVPNAGLIFDVELIDFKQ